ncbi:MAG: hypothetical protein QOH06_5292 [Acidobacteriota bacterium]|jgi:hypothetical protein|nr:hypothetical protein [Acidobacteriota bacterium]
MPDSDNNRRDVAGRFLQATRNKTFDLTHRLFPAELAAQITETADREVEDQGLQAENIEVILHWFRSDADVEWLERFWQTPEGSRFLDLSVELMMRSILRRFGPEVPLPPPGNID